METLLTLFSIVMMLVILAAICILVSVGFFYIFHQVIEDELEDDRKKSPEDENKD